LQAAADEITAALAETGETKAKAGATKADGMLKAAE
jgi:hypothetical protein